MFDITSVFRTWFEIDVSKMSATKGMGLNGAASDPLNGTANGIKDLPPLYTHCVDDYRPMKVIVIGAGLSGILAGIRFPQYIKNLDLTIYDKNTNVGGTWFENKYPGVRCDVPSHCYQYTFER